ncbi:uncharacterized protein LOC143185252 [Calliopsis andreniformis]|uniref:uncharacterized protein LOC143185252 n=1 Tax=Calliopsis andreniformis TaxID=337506 RepID=UPI003FCDCD66
MKNVLALPLLLTVVEGALWWSDNINNRWKGPVQLPGQPFQPPGQSFQPPGQSFQPPGPPFPFPGLGLGRHHHQNWHSYPQQGDIRNAEWICQNQRTRDMIIVTAVDGAQTFINEQPLPQGTWSNSNNNDNSNNLKPNSMNPNHGNNINPATTTPLPNNPTTETKKDESPLQHAGEGLIDIRFNPN